MQEIDCKNICKKTRAVRESGFCIGVSKFDGKKIIWGCEEGLSGVKKEDRVWMECQTWDAQIISACNSCPLSCFKNPKKKEKESKLKIIQKALSEVKVTAAGFGLSAEQIEKISDVYSYAENLTEDQLAALNSAKMANDAIMAISDKKSVDLSLVKALRENVSFKKIRKKI
jgi:hypothetical protein